MRPYRPDELKILNKLLMTAIEGRVNIQHGSQTDTEGNITTEHRSQTDSEGTVTTDVRLSASYQND